MSSSASSSTKPSYSIHFSAHQSSSKPSSMSYSMFKHDSSKPSNFSSGTVKPSFFSSGLEAFSKHSVYRSTIFNKLKGIKDISTFDVTHNGNDPALVNYDKWLKVHKQQQEELSAKLKRPPECMVMNTNLNTLYTNQEKHLINEASNYDYWDKQRGHPIFWEPDAVAEHGKSFGVYQTLQQKYDRSRENYWPHPKEREYVGVPNEINKEKGLVFEGQCLKVSQQKWDDSKYVKDRKNQLKDKLEIMQEHKPRLSELIVIGQAISYSDGELSQSYSSEQQKSKRSVTTSTDGLDPDCKNKFKTIFMVGDKEIKENSKLITITFENCFINQKYEKSLTIKNTNEISALKYFWQIITPNWAKNELRLPLVHVKVRSKCFYFDKIPAAVLPCEEKSLSFQFKSSVVGVFSESWELLMSHTPDQWESIILKIFAVAIEPPSNILRLIDIDSYLESCTKLTVAKKTIKNIFDRMRPQKIEDFPYDWKFFEEQLFVYNNPDLFYDNKCVAILKSLHDKCNGGPWDYSVKNLRENLILQSSDGGSIDDLNLYTSTIYKLMRPHLTTFIVSEKHKTVYEVLCSFVSKIEYEGINLKLIYGIPLNLKFSKDLEDEPQITNNSSATSSKLSTRSSRKMSVKKSITKTKSSLGKITLPSEMSLASTAYSESKIGDSISSSIISGTSQERRKQEFLEALYIKTYQYLCKTIDHVSAALDSFDNNKKKSILIALKDRDF